MLLPKARTAKLTVRELPDETLVFDHDRNKAHCLNRTAALVWKHCDGKTSTSKLASMLQRELGVPAAEQLVYLALEQLQRRRLLEPLPAESAEVRQGRRQVLRKLGVSLAAVPFIMTMMAPRANAAASKPAATCPSGETMCSGTCVNLQTNSSNCGTCAKACTALCQTTCTGGTCGPTVCGPGEACCGGLCTVLRTTGSMCTSGCQCMSGLCVNPGMCT